MGVRYMKGDMSEVDLLELEFVGSEVKTQKVCVL